MVIHFCEVAFSDLEKPLARLTNSSNGHHQIRHHLSKMKYVFKLQDVPPPNVSTKKLEYPDYPSLKVSAGNKSTGCKHHKVLSVRIYNTGADT